MSTHNNNPLSDSDSAAFGRGSFFISRDTASSWQTGLRDYFDYRDMGMTEVTQGKLRAHVIRPNKPCPEQGDLHYHKVEFQMVYVLKGWARMYFEGVGEVTLDEGCCVYQEPGIVHRLIEWSDDYTVIELLVPADPETVTVAP